jgi:hypothetical protein
MLSVREIESGDGFQLYGTQEDWAAFRAGVIFSSAAASKPVAGLEIFSGLRIEAAGIHAGIVSTDRYRLAWAELSGLDVEGLQAAAVDHAGIIPARDLLAGVKSSKISGPFSLVIDNAAGVWSLSVNDSTISGRTISGKFPEWRGLVPELAGDSAGGFALSPDLLAGFMSGIAKAFNSKDSKPVTLSQAADLKPVLLSGFSNSARGLIMPVRTV